MGIILIAQAISLCFASDVLDPLSQDEIARLTALTEHKQQGAAQKTTKHSTEMLLIERHHDKNNRDKRLATVYKYNYDLDQTLAHTFDLTANQLQHQEVLTGTQLPLTKSEHAEVERIVFSDPEQLTLMQQIFSENTGGTIFDSRKLTAKAFIFISDSLPEQLTPAARRCGEQRCAQVLLYVNDAAIFEIIPIVNLSEGIVVQNLYHD